MTWKTLLSLALLAGPAFAELPPGSYNALRAEADEALLIEVESVATKALKPGWTDVVVSARVVAVERSKAGTKKGEKVAIRYKSLDRDKVEKPVLGASSVPILAKGEFYPAFLKKAEGEQGFEPAAYGSSFAMSPEAR